MKFTTSTTLALILASCAFAAAPPDVPPCPEKAICRIEWRLRWTVCENGCERIEREGYHGTGTLIGPRGKHGPLVLTAAHVMEGRGGWRSKRASVFVENKHYYATVLSCDPHTDVCWLRLDLDDATERLPYALLQDHAPKSGQAVWHKGHSSFRDGSIERGRVTRLETFKGFAELRIYSRSGDSGAAFFCERTGRVVATLYGGHASTRTDYGPTCVQAAKLKPKE